MELIRRPLTLYHSATIAELNVYDPTMVVLLGGMLSKLAIGGHWVESLVHVVTGLHVCTVPLADVKVRLRLAGVNPIAFPVSLVTMFATVMVQLFPPSEQSRPCEAIYRLVSCTA